MLDTSKHENLESITEFAFPVYVSPGLVAAVQRLWETFRLPDDRLAGLLGERVDPLMAQILTDWSGDRC